jgi:hypothetical protein
MLAFTFLIYYILFITKKEHNIENVHKTLSDLKKSKTVFPRGFRNKIQISFLSENWKKICLLL